MIADRRPPHIRASTQGRFQRPHGGQGPVAGAIVMARTARPKGTTVALILMILAPLPLGFFVRNRLAAFVVWTALHAFVFTFQTLSLVLEWATGSSAAFGAAFPAYEKAEMFAYGAVNLVIYAVGTGLLLLGARLGSRRRSREHAVLDA